MGARVVPRITGQEDLVQGYLDHSCDAPRTILTDIYYGLGGVAKRMAPPCPWGKQKKPHSYVPDKTGRF